jgi:hypothetical protein
MMQPVRETRQMVKWLRVTVAQLVLAWTLHAQGATTVSSSDPVYRTIDRLAAIGLVDTLVMGQRPWSRRTVGRMVAAARRAASRSDAPPLPPWIRESLEAAAIRFPTDTSRGAPEPRWLASLTRVQLDASTATTDARAVPPQNGLGGIDALIDPLMLPLAPGRGLVTGSPVMEIGSLHELTVRDFGLAAAPTLRFTQHAGANDSVRLSLERLSVRWRTGDVALLAGREPLQWGQSARRALFLSGNGPALDMLWVGTDAPVTLPGPLRFAGPSALSLFVADLGAEQHFPHTKLAGYKWSMTPTRTFELGLSVLDFVGGQGAPPASTIAVIRNLFLFPVLPTEGNEFSNTMAGIEARLRLPALAHAELYWELNADDFDRRRISSSLWTDDAAQLLGLAFPAIGADGRVAFTLELHHTGRRFGRHLQFESGATLDRTPLGDPLGPDADGGYLVVEREWTRGIRAEMELAEEVYRDNDYTITTNPFAFHLATTRPQERRHRASLTVRRVAAPGMELVLEGGAEWIRDSGFRARESHVGGMARVGWRWLVH